MAMLSEALKSALLENREPIIRWKLVNQVLERTVTPDEYQAARTELSSSPIIQRLLCDRNTDGQIPYHPYDKWFGAHWILSILADLGYPKGDETLKPLLEQCYAWLLSEEHQKNIRCINGRVRRCASQEGNCVYYSLALGIADERTDELASRLIKWQWVDGGWNCDKKPEAEKSSFHETLIPTRGLLWFANLSGDPKAKEAVARSVEVFLKRKLFRRLSGGQPMDINFLKLHYPCYWHYDVLFGLKVIAEAGFIDDPRCAEAVQLLLSKQLPNGSFPAEARYYRVDDKKLTGHSRVNWGGTSKVKMNPFVTLDAIKVLKHAGKLVW
jgi:hypothetical protein